MMEKLITLLGTGLAALLAMLAFASVASAEATFDYGFGSGGAGGGQFAEPAGIAQNLSTGNLYVADRQNNRIQEFTEEGAFVQAWGFDVVESGVDDKPFIDEIQSVTVRGVAGTFKLSYGGDTTTPLAYNASAATVEAALNALPAISGSGSVAVSGGPGDANGTNPYTVTFNGGGIGQSDQEQLTIDRSQLVRAVGTELNCTGVAYWVTQEGHFDYQWLRDGQPIAGETSPTYLTTAADAGKALQCQVEAHYEQYEPYPKGWATSSDYVLVGSIPTPPPPAPPHEIATPSVVSGSLASPGTGATLKCEAGEWANSPTEYTYQWFISPRTPEARTEPVTTASTSNELVLTEGDVAKHVLIQCKVTAKNASGSATMWSNLQRTNPGPPTGGLYNIETPAARITYPAGTSLVATTLNGGPVFETCKAGTNDVCKAGVPGPGMGQFSEPRGVAVDNSPGGAGAVWVGDDKNYRVQKLAENGSPILEIGDHVNQTTEGNLCVVGSGDVCYTGRLAEDLTPGAFGGWPPSFGKIISWDELGNTVAVDSHNGNLYVTDPYEKDVPWEGRIQAFDSSGQFIGQARLPRPLEPIWGTSVGMDSEQHVLVTGSFGVKRGVEIFDESEFTPEGTQRGFAERNMLNESNVSMHVSGDPTSNIMWIVDRNESEFGGPAEHVCGNESNNSSPRRGLLAYDNEGHFFDCTVPQGAGAITSAAGVTVSPDGSLAFVTLRKDNKIKVFRLPRPSLPSAQGGFVDNVTEHFANFHGEGSPGFEATEAGFEYGTSPCIAPGDCTTVEATKIYGLKMQKYELPLEGLQPSTKYYYRAVTTNAIGTARGPEHTFTTYRFVDLNKDRCSNALVRKQTRTAGMLDCRAYELASAGFTGGYDVSSDLAPEQDPFEGAPEATGKLLYAVQDGGIPGTGKPTNHGPDPYVAVRDEATKKWVTQYVGIPSDINASSPPFSSTPADFDGLLTTFAFAGPEICDPCFGNGSSGIPVHMPDGSLVQGMTGTTPNTAAKSEGYVRRYLSDDGTHLVFGSRTALESDAHAGELAIYDRNLETGTTHVVSKTPGGQTMQEEGEEIGELDISADGSRILFGKLVGDDAAGRHWKLFMNVGDSPTSIELTPGTTTGVLYDGMSADGTRVFFSTRDSLAGDSDTSADIYEAEVSASGMTLELVSGAPSDSCDPIGNPNDWNVVSGSGRCDAVGIGGGAGVAGDGTAYFLSPQLLDGGAGEENAANLYVVRPGSTSPEFVATVDGGAQKPPPPPLHPIANSELVTGLSNPESLAVDQSNGDIYVDEQGTNSILRYKADGSAQNFTAGPGSGTNKITGQNFGNQGKGAVAVDSSGGLMNGNFYATTLGSTIKVFANTGAELGTLTGFNETCGVAVDNSNGTVYVADPSAGTLWRFAPTSAPAGSVSNANFSVTKLTIVGQLCNLAADGAGHVYASNYPGGPPRRFNASEFTAEAPLREGTPLKVGGVSHLTYADPATDELYVDTGSKIIIFDSSGQIVKEFGEGAISGYGGIAVNGGEGASQSSRAHHVYAVNGGKIVEFGIEPDTYEPVDEQAILDAVRDHDTHHWSDFQTSANGRYALFASREESANPGYDNGHFRMIYRYDTSDGALSCVSCIPTEARPSADAALPSKGLGLTEDGRAFFNSLDPLVPRDSNKKLDAYEWAPFDPNWEEDPGSCELALGCQALVSTGYSSYPSSLLSVTNDGTDAFFFTREVLVNDDHNGQTMKVYDARTRGGFFQLPASPPCAASDECHGPSSQAAPPPPIGTHEQGGGNARRMCKKGFVLRRGHCVKQHKKHKKHKKKQRKHHRRNHRAAGHGKGESR